MATSLRGKCFRHYSLSTGTFLLAVLILLSVHVLWKMYRTNQYHVVQVGKVISL